MSKKQSFLDEPLPENGKRHLRIVITEANERNEFLTIPVDTLHNRTQCKLRTIKEHFSLMLWLFLQNLQSICSQYIHEFLLAPLLSSSHASGVPNYHIYDNSVRYICYGRNVYTLAPLKYILYAAKVYIIFKIPAAGTKKAAHARNGARGFFTFLI